MAEISLCLVTRNEEENIQEFLESVEGLADEIIIVDSSADKTKEIAKEFGCKVFDFKQKEREVTSARNFSLSKASKEWILVLDPDERISKRDFQRIKELTKKNEFLGYYLIQRHYTNKIGTANWISSINDEYRESKIASGWHENPILRLFKNDKRIKYGGEAHETVDRSIKKIGKVYLTDIPIHHFGELNREEFRKSDRNINFLKKDLEKNEKEKFFVYFQLACELIGKNEPEKAIKYLKKSLKLNPKYFPSLLNLGGIYTKQKRLDEAEKILNKALIIRQNSDLYNNLGVIYSEKKEFNRAIKKFEKALQLNPNSADAYFNLGLVYFRKGKQKKSVPFFQKAIELNPEYKKKVNIQV